VNEQNVGIAANTHRKRGTSSDGDRFDRDTARGSERGNEHVEQAGVLRTRRRRQDERWSGKRGLGGPGERDERKDGKAAYHSDHFAG
jgi:hypothetical protein